MDRPNEEGQRVVHPQPVTDFLCHELLGSVADNVILGRTEIAERMGPERCIFRAHPNYRSVFANKAEIWDDWATFEFGEGEHREEKPGQISAFVDLGDFDDGTAVVVRGRHMIVMKKRRRLRLIHYRGFSEKEMAGARCD
jgi:hypothetical protein